MRATFVGGPCGGHSHAIEDNDTPETRGPGCAPSTGGDTVTGHYARLASANKATVTGPPKATDTIYYRWVTGEAAHER